MNKTRANNVISLTDKSATSDGKVTIEPGVPKTAAVALDADLEDLALGDLGNGLELQDRGISVNSLDNEADSGLPPATDGRR
jgi:hypothetical protein